ncbi:uncharacterized protein [Temnothorax nylanderi]|uniref:uncharacterized protein n=1 Tax=Temnothorax nylanderi TaxID=102681 RepID=UPI003A851862
MVFASTFDDLAIRMADMAAYREKCGLIVVQHGVRDACGTCVFSSPCLAHDGGIPGISTRDRGRRSRQFCIEVHIGGIRVPCLASPINAVLATPLLCIGRISLAAGSWIVAGPRVHGPLLGLQLCTADFAPGPSLDRLWISP